MFHSLLAEINGKATIRLPSILFWCANFPYEHTIDFFYICFYILYVYLLYILLYLGLTISKWFNFM